jgi:hypothetical protein
MLDLIRISGPTTFGLLPRVLDAMLPVDERYRSYKDPIRYRMMIRNLWAEVLSEPGNPPTPPVPGPSADPLRQRTAKAAELLLGTRVAIPRQTSVRLRRAVR